MKVRSKKVTDMAENSIYFFKDPINYEEKALKKYFTSDATEILTTIRNTLSDLESFTSQEIEKKFHEISEKTNISAGKLIHPTRLAVSGVSFGPGLFEMLEVLGKETVNRRIITAINFIRGNM
jgi:glutamyl-tRNA synthetase